MQAPLLQCNALPSAPLQNDVKDSTVMIGNATATLLKYENNVFEYVASDHGIDEAAINPINNIAPTIS